jgi:hypothetical protein
MLTAALRWAVHRPNKQLHSALNPLPLMSEGEDGIVASHYPNIARWNWSHSGTWGRSGQDNPYICSKFLAMIPPRQNRVGFFWWIGLLIDASIINCQTRNEQYTLTFSLSESGLNLPGRAWWPRFWYRQLCRPINTRPARLLLTFFTRDVYWRA